MKKEEISIEKIIAEIKGLNIADEDKTKAIKFFEGLQVGCWIGPSDGDGKSPLLSIINKDSIISNLIIELIKDSDTAY